MSSPTPAGTFVAAATGTRSTAASTEPLRRLYFVRFGSAIVWAGLLAVSASTLNPVSVALLVTYPVFDLAAAAYDSRTSGDRPRAFPIATSQR